jgi:hypothetical protein
MFKRDQVYRDESGNVVGFIPMTNVPGYTHKVIVNREQVGWLGDGWKPCAKSAAYFLGMWLKKHSVAA